MQRWGNLSSTALCMLLALYIGAVLNLPMAWQRLGSMAALRQPWQRVGLMLLELGALVLFNFVLLRLFSLAGRRVFKLLATVVVLISVAAAWYIQQFKLVIGYGVVASVLTTDIDLSVEILSLEFGACLLAFGVLPLALIALNRSRATLLQQSRHKQSALRAWAQLLLAVLLLALPLRALNAWQKQAERAANTDLPDYAGTLAYSYLPINWLSATALFSYMTLQERYNGPALFNPASAFNYQPPADIDQLYLVFIIGETTRWDHMQLLGYPRATTPLLAAEPNLVALRGVACDTATKLSLRCMFVRPGGAADNAQRTLQEKNIFLPCCTTWL